jgi:SAM-dependent methyltransferase
MDGAGQSEATDYADLELLYNAFMAPALRPALGGFLGGRPHAVDGCGLDVGCGPGGVIPLLLEASDADRVVGIDLSGPHLASAARRLAAEGRHARVRLVATDLRATLPFADDSFAWAWAADVLWPDIVAEPRRVVRELHRVVRPGGRVAAFFGNWLRAIFLPGHSHIEHALCAATEMACFRRTLTPAAHHENALSWLRAAGFTRLDLSTYLVQYRHPLPEPVLRYIQEVIFAEYRRPAVGRRARRLGVSDDDWRRWLALSDPDSPGNVLGQEDYYCLQIGTLMTGVVPPRKVVAGDPPDPAAAPRRAPVGLGVASD